VAVFSLLSFFLKFVLVLYSKYNLCLRLMHQYLCYKSRMREGCIGRSSSFFLMINRHESVVRLRKEHNDEVKQLKDQIQEMEEKQRKETKAMEGKIQILLKAMLSQNTTGLDTEALADLITTSAADANNVLRSSTSIFAQDDNEVKLNYNL